MRVEDGNFPGVELAVLGNYRKGEDGNGEVAEEHHFVVKYLDR